jgi:hypothetical protein
MFRRALTAAGAILVLFHVWLLSDQAWAGQLAEPARLLRWLAAFSLLGTLIVLRCRGVSLLRGRKAVVVWLLAVLLHGPSVADRIGTTGVPAVSEVASALAQLAVASAAVVGLRLLVELGRARKNRQSRPAGARIAPAGTLIGVLSPDAFLHITPRPPPVQ